MTIKYLDIGKYRFSASDTNLLIQQLDNTGLNITDAYITILDVSLNTTTKLSNF